jgi:hypothetical protein
VVLVRHPNKFSTRRRSKRASLEQSVCHEVVDAPLQLEPLFLDLAPENRTKPSQKTGASTNKEKESPELITIVVIPLQLSTATKELGTEFG